MLAVTLTVAGCTTMTIAPGLPGPSARLGTLVSAYPVSNELKPGIQVIDHFPRPGFDGSPLKSDKYGCGWFG